MFSQRWLLKPHFLSLIYTEQMGLAGIGSTQPPSSALRFSEAGVRGNSVLVLHGWLGDPTLSQPVEVTRTLHVPVTVLSCAVVHLSHAFYSSMGLQEMK